MAATGRLSIKQFKTFQQLVSKVAKYAEEEESVVSEKNEKPSQPAENLSILGASVERRALKPSLQMDAALGQINALKKRLEQYLERKLEPSEEVSLKSVKTLKLAVQQAEQDFRKRKKEELDHRPFPRPSPPKGA